MVKLNKEQKKKISELNSYVDIDYQPPDNLNDLFSDKLKGEKSTKRDGSSSPPLEVNLETDCFGGRRLKRIHDEVIPHEYPLPQNSSFCHSIIVGGTGSGKSTFLLTLLMKYRNLSGVILISLIEGLTIYKLIGEYCKQHGLNYYFESDPQEGYNRVIDEVNNKKEGTQTLIIFDDAQSGKSLKSSSSTPENKVMLHLFSKSRNYGCNVCCITQSYITIPTPIRSNVNMIIYYKISNKSTINIFKQDWCNMTGYDRSVIDNLLTHTSEPHSYILTTNEPKVYLYEPSKYVEGQKLEPIDPMKGFGSVSVGDDILTLTSKEFNKLVSYLMNDNNGRVQELFIAYIKMLIDLKGYDKNKLKDFIRTQYNIELGL